MFDFVEQATRETIPVTFSIGQHLDRDGNVPEFTHEMTVVDEEDELRRLGNHINQKPAGKSTKATRQAAAEQAIFEVWSELVVSVSNYNERVDELTGAELRAEFRGEHLPENLDEETRAKARRGMTLHVTMAVWGYFDRLSPEPSFRQKRS